MLKKILIGVVLLLITGTQVARAAEYYLPYPGILPDHPFYWLKMIRDRLQLTLIAGNEAKAEKMLFFSDKRLGAGWALIDGGKQALGITTLTKAEKYLEKAVSLGKETGLKERLKSAVIKHEQVLKLNKEKVAPEFKPAIEEMLVKVNILINELEAKRKAVTKAKIEVNFNGEIIGAEVEAETALEALKKIAEEKEWRLETKNYDFGELVESVNGFKNKPEAAWIYYVNKEIGTVGADKKELKENDLVEWRYEKPSF